jgi:hypothetical protein
MKSFARAILAVFLSFLMAMLFCALAVAQGPAEVSAAEPAAAAATPEPLPAAPAPQYGSPFATGDNWRGTVSIYGWLPGVHGTVGVLGHNAGFSAPFSDVFHFLKGIIPVAVEVNKGRFVMPLDFFWVKLAQGTATPFTDTTGNFVNVHLTESIFTPMAGYRLLNGEHLKIDALGGIRYWYVGENLQLIGTPVPVPAFVRSQGWVDGLGGARFIIPLSEKAAVTVSGNAGAGGANLDYQVIGLFSYNLTPKIGVGLGWRYLDVDYRPTNKQFVFDTITTGALAGVYFNFGGKPPVPPTASCSASPTEVYPGDPVTATMSAQNFDPKHAIAYGWTSTGAKVSGTGTTASVDTTGLAPGTYSVTGTATDKKEKKNNVASCSASFVVKARPNYPPTASCSVSPNAIAINQAATVTISARSPENRALTYNWTSSGGQLTQNGTSASVVATNADAGSTITVTGTATDDHGLSASCNAIVTVPAVQKVAEVEDWGECTFEKNPKKPWRVDNDCKDVLDKIALRIQQMPNGKVAIVGYNAQEEVVEADHIGAQRAVNVKYYMSTDELGPKVDPTRIEPRKGGAKGKAAHFYFVPQGATLTAEESVTVDETAVQGQSRGAAAPAKKGKKAAAPPASN